MNKERSLITFLIDTSYSMCGQRIDFVEKGMMEFKKVCLDAQKDYQEIDVSIITYGNGVEVYYHPPFLPLGQIQDLDIHCSGITPMRQALEVGVSITHDWGKIKETDTEKKTPIIVLLTDGSPTDDLNDVFISTINDMQKKKKFMLLSVGIGPGHDDKVLKSLLIDLKNYIDLSDEYDIIPFFKSFAQSITNGGFVVI